MRQKILIGCLLLLFVENSLGQIIIKDCANQLEISDVVVYNTQRNKIIGISDKNGKVIIDSKILDITLVHPEYGTIKTVNQDVICLEGLLNTIVVETQPNVKKELLAILQETYNQYHTDPLEKQFFSYQGSIYENNDQGELLVQDQGYLTYKKYYNTILFMSDRLGDQIKCRESVSLLPLKVEHKNYFFFTNKKQLKSLVKHVKKFKVKKMNTDYIVYDDHWDHSWLFEVDSVKGVVIRFVNTEVEINCFEPKDFFKRESTLDQRLIEVNYSWEDNQLKQRLDLVELYGLTSPERKRAKYLTIQTCNKEEVTIESSYSLTQYLGFHVKRRMEIRKLVDAQEKDKKIKR